jgi:protoheme IX farnesyltransferase
VREKLKIVLELSKVRITVLASLTTATGYFMAARELTISVVLPTAGIFLLACGSSALNQYQEREIDAVMRRTRQRPIPSGRVSPRAALAVALALMSFGTLVLWLGSNPTAAVLGLVAVAWYNGIYTYLKRVTNFAAVPGAVIGGIPPAVGWAAAGGGLLDPRILALSFFFFVWQVPHFWLLLMRYGRDYEDAGLPSLTAVFTSGQLSRVTFVWIAATAVTCLLIPLFGAVRSVLVSLGLLAAGGWLVWNAVGLLKPSEESLPLRLPFREINILALVVICLISLDSVIFSLL